MWSPKAKPHTILTAILIQGSLTGPRMSTHTTSILVGAFGFSFLLEFFLREIETRDKQCTSSSWVCVAAYIVVSTGHAHVWKNMSMVARSRHWAYPSLFFILTVLEQGLTLNGELSSSSRLSVHQVSASPRDLPVLEHALPPPVPPCSQWRPQLRCAGLHCKHITDWTISSALSLRFCRIRLGPGIIMPSMSFLQKHRNKAHSQQYTWL